MINTKTCKGCGHRSSKTCNLSGLYCTVERKNNTKCDIDFKGWIPRKGIRQRILEIWYGALNNKEDENKG